MNRWSICIALFALALVSPLETLAQDGSGLADTFGPSVETPAFAAGGDGAMLGDADSSVSSGLGGGVGSGFTGGTAPLASDPVAPVADWSGAAGAASTLGSVLSPLGQGLNDYLFERARTNILMAEGLTRAGLGLITLPPMKTMENNIHSWGNSFLGEERMGDLWSGYEANRRAARSEVIASRGLFGAARFGRQLQQPQPASFYYDNFARPRLASRWPGIFGGR